MSQVIVTDRFESPIALRFHECKNSLSTIYLSDTVPDVRVFELPIVNTCELFKKVQPAAFRRNVYILLKIHPRTWIGTYSVSNVSHSTFCVQPDYQFLEVNYRDVKTNIMDAYDGDGVCLEAIIGYSGATMTIVPLRLKDKDVETTTTHLCA